MLVIPLLRSSQFASAIMRSLIEGASDDGYERQPGKPRSALPLSQPSSGADIDRMYVRCTSYRARQLADQERTERCEL